MIKLAMITECWTPQSSHRDTFSLYNLFIVLYVYAIAKIGGCGNFVIDLSSKIGTRIQIIEYFRYCRYFWNVYFIE